jgi:hypothetical protein
MSVGAPPVGADVWVSRVTDAIDGDRAARDLVIERREHIDWGYVYPRVIERRPDSKAMLSMLRYAPGDDGHRQNGSHPAAAEEPDTAPTWRTLADIDDTPPATSSTRSPVSLLIRSPPGVVDERHGDGRHGIDGGRIPRAAVARRTRQEPR